MSIARYISKLGALLNSNGQVLAGGIADDGVITSKILNANITTPKIADANITAQKLAAGAARANFGAGAVLQVVSVPKTDTFSTTSQSFVDVTGLSATITPSSSTSTILIMCSVSLGAVVNNFSIMPRIARNGSPIFVSDAAGSRIQAAAMYEMGNANTTPVSIIYKDAPGTTSAVTYTLQVRVNGGTGRVNASAGDSDMNTWSRSVSSITLLEIAG